MKKYFFSAKQKTVVSQNRMVNGRKLLQTTINGKEYTECTSLDGSSNFDDVVLVHEGEGDLVAKHVF